MASLHTFLTSAALFIAALFGVTIPADTTPAPFVPHHSQKSVSSVPSLDAAIISSSTVAIGSLNVIVECKNSNPYNIQITQNGSILQNLPLKHASFTVGFCPKAEIQDVNFDGSPDFMVPSSSGTAGSGFNYWLFSTTTQKFECDDNCFFINPSFDSSTKTVTAVTQLGAGTRVTDIYQVKNGKLIDIKEERVDLVP